jgi:5'-nucleotidase
MNYVGYQAAAIGNHEFDFGLASLDERITQAQFKLLGANICSLDEDPEACSRTESFHTARFAKKFIIHKTHGIKLGIIGLTTPQTPTTTLPINVSHFKFMPLAKTLERFVPIMKSQGAETIIVIVHDGDGSMLQVIDELKPETRAEISIVLAGHTHNYANKIHKGVRILISGCYGKSFGYTTLSYNEYTKHWSAQKSENIHFKPGVSFLGKQVQSDTEASELLATEISESNALSSRVVGKLISPLKKTDTGESNLGDFMTDAFRLCDTQSCTGTADIAFLNNGGIRSRLLEAGPITYGQVFELMPFDNIYTELKLTGSQIHDLLDLWYSYKNDSPTPQVSGLNIRYSKNTTRQRTIQNGAGDKQTILDPIDSITFSNGKLFEENKTYRVVVSDFLATGGGGTAFILKGLPTKPEFHYDRTVRDQIVDYFQLNPAGWDYKETQNRIQIEP